MDESANLGDQTPRDITIRLKTTEGRTECYPCRSSVLSLNSKFFAERLSNISSSNEVVEIPCSGSDYDHHVCLLELVHLKPNPPLEYWASVSEALGILRVAIPLGFEAISQSCIQYLEAVPWEEDEEEEILNLVKNLGPMADSILARIKPVDKNVAQELLLAAIHFAVSNNLENRNLKISAQEQVEYMLTGEEEAKSLASDEQVKTQISKDVTDVFSAFLKAIDSLPEEEREVLHVLSDLNWLCDVLSKMGMMKFVVSHWVDSSEEILKTIQKEKLNLGFWEVKKMIVEISGKALEAVGFGTVAIPPHSRVWLLKAWLPYLRKTKVELEEKSNDGLDSEILEGIEGAVVSLVLSLPSNDQADILKEWMDAISGTRFLFPNLSEAFEVWCYRAKAAKRRISMEIDGIGSSKEVTMASSSTAAPWKHLLLSALETNANLKHSRFFQLATINSNGRPSNRTVVFRGFSGGGDKIQINTDCRSNKIEDLKNCPFGEICWYFTDSWEQFRLSGRIEIIDGSNPDPLSLQKREKSWFASSLNSRTQYLGPHPGLPRIFEESNTSVDLDPLTGPASAFCLLEFDPEQVDYLNLRTNERLVYRSRLEDGGRHWVIQRVNP